MIDRLVDLATRLANLFVFVRVIECYERGVLLRLGKFRCVLDPGLRFIVPFGVDVIHHARVVLDTMELPPQAFVTRDDVDCVATAIVTFKVRDIRKFLLETEDAEGVLADSTRAAIRHVLCNRTMAELRSGESLDEDITATARRKAFNYGIEIVNVSLSDLVRAKALRLLVSGNAALRHDKVPDAN